MTKTIDKLSVYEMTQCELTELLRHEEEVSAYAYEIQRGLRRKMYEQGHEDGSKKEEERKHFDDVFDLIKYTMEGTEWRKPKTGRQFLEESRNESQERRDEIVKQAKADVREIKFRMGYTAAHPYIKFGMNNTEVDYVVNSEKRIVVALIKYKYRYERGVLSKGIAKCAPNDCFNSHIGKAIALRRALGLDVPVEYLNTPQPTEVRIGDVVKCVKEKSKYLGNGKVIRKDIGMFGARLYVVEDGSMSYEETAKIIDDSREEE